jgi:NADPH2:quinone reductase
MKALICTQHGGPEQLHLQSTELDPPGKGEVRIEVHACGINFPDVLMVAGKHQLTPRLPFCPGGEVAGVVRAVGAGVTTVRTGQRVMAVTFTGGLAEEVNAPARAVVAVPDAMDFTTAAVFQGGNAVSYYALKRRAALRKDEYLLVLGAAGGVGLAAVQVGRAMGARVIGVVDTDDKAAGVLRHGAEAAINCSSEKVRERIRTLTGGRGADVIIDMVGGDLFDEACRSVNMEARILIVGFASGRIPSYPVNLALLRSCSLIGVNHHQFFVSAPEQADADMRELLQMYRDGAIRPVIDHVYPLAQTGEALRRIAEGTVIGKVVVAVR